MSDSSAELCLLVTNDLIKLLERLKRDKISYDKAIKDLKITKEIMEKAVEERKKIFELQLKRNGE